MPVIFDAYLIYELGWALIVFGAACIGIAIRMGLFRKKMPYYSRRRILQKMSPEEADRELQKWFANHWHGNNNWV
jgi:hypothetical protein